MLFNSSYIELLVYTALKLSFISMVVNSVYPTLPLSHSRNLQQINHPADFSLVLAIHYSTVHIREWGNL